MSKSKWTIDSQDDLYVWLDDIEANIADGNISDIVDSVGVIGNLPFVQDWTVRELVAAIMDR